MDFFHLPAAKFSSALRKHTVKHIGILQTFQHATKILFSALGTKKKFYFCLLHRKQEEKLKRPHCGAAAVSLLPPSNGRSKYQTTAWEATPPVCASSCCREDARTENTPPPHISPPLPFMPRNTSASEREIIQKRCWMCSRRR